MKNKENGIVLKLQDYKEKDGLAWMMTPEKIFSVRVRGVQSTTSRLRSGCQPFTLAEWGIESRKQGIPLLIQVNPLYFYYQKKADLTVQALTFLLRDLLIRSHPTPVLYEAFLSYLQCMQEPTEELYARACFILREILRMEGIHPYVDGCVLCHRKEAIETISEKEGGFLCHFCNPSPYTMSKIELTKIYALFHVSFLDLEKMCSLYSFTIQDCLFWASWYERYAQISIKSLSFLKTVVQLKA